MRLKSLEMQGFKSFADRTVINFDHGVTIVVGPNGSGKSNISDAIRWVLGEMSTKNIRGSKMEDVIFGGTKDRQPMSFAEVSLCFDNTDPESRIDSDYSEITVTRRYHRSGDSEYMINKKSVRLKDITELFLNTGIGKNGYSIIGQGNIANVLSQKSEDRRTIFEEAAGISKYRYKKLEAERNLHTAEENLLRLCDINAELESRIGPLENESKKAQQYLEIYENKKIADVAVWTYDIDNIKSKFDEIDLKYKLSKNDYDDSELELETLEAQNEDAFSKSQESKLKSEQTLTRINELNQKMHAIESEIKVLENDTSYISLQSEQTKAEIEAGSTERSSALSEINALELKLSKEKEEFGKISGEQEKNGEQIASLQEEADNCRKNAEAINIEIAALSENIMNKKLMISSIEGSHSSDDARLSEINEQKNTEQSKVDDINRKIEKKQKQIDEYQRKNNALEKEKKEYMDELSSLSATHTELKDKIAALELDIDSKTHRKDTLKRMEELLEGYSGSVRTVVNAFEDGKIRGICGPVSKLISVNKKYAVAIETALGAGIQNIVTEDEDAAKAAINYLKENNAGRTTFYPLTSVKPSYIGTPENELKRKPGYIGLASTLVTFDKKYEKIIDFLLARTAVFENIDFASAAAKAFDYKFKIVTLDGQVINAGGSYTGGSIRRESGILSRNTEIDALSKQIKDSQKELSDAKLSSEKIADTINAAEEKLHECEESLGISSVLLNSETTQLSILKNELENSEKRIEALRTESFKLGTDKESSDNEHKKISSEILQLESDMKKAEERFGEEESKRMQISSSLSDAYERNNELILISAEKRNLIQNCEKEIDSLTQKISGLDVKISELSEISAGTERKLNEIKEKISAGTKSFGKLSDEASECEKLRRELGEATEKYEILINELRNKIKDCTHRRESLFQIYTKLESQREKVLGEQDLLTAKLWDEYEMTFSAAKEYDRSGICESNYREFASKQNELKAKLKRLGPVNVNAINEYKEVKERYEFLSAQIEDITKSKEDLINIISKLEKEMQSKFNDTFAQININFKRVFRELFGGGTAELVLTDPNDTLASGVEINVAPPGKIINNISLLSGGEKSFVAIALFFAILNVNPSPFCILDEIESALDEVNVGRFAEYSKHYSEKTQFIIITHRRGTMESADTLYGITMKERGISTVLSLDVKDAEAKMGVKIE